MAEFNNISQRVNAIHEKIGTNTTTSPNSTSASNVTSPSNATSLSNATSASNVTSPSNATSATPTWLRISRFATFLPRKALKALKALKGLQWIPRLQVISRHVATLAGISSLVYTASLCVLYGFQRNVLYVPRIPFMRPNPEGHWYMESPSRYNMQFENIEFRSEDNKMIHGWLLFSPDSIERAPTVLWCQSNAGDISHRLENAKIMTTRLRCNIFLLSYRGFGPSQGSPEQTGITMDAKAALRLLHNRPDIDSNKIYVFGRSLGGAVAIQLAKSIGDADELKISGLVLENTFTSVKDIAYHMFPFLSYYIGWNPWLQNKIIRDKWDSKTAITSIKCPILFISSQRDETIPVKQMRALYDTLPESSDKRLLTLPNANHMNAWLVSGGRNGQGSYWDAMSDFIR